MLDSPENFIVRHLIVWHSQIMYQLCSSLSVLFIYVLSVFELFAWKYHITSITLSVGVLCHPFGVCIPTRHEMSALCIFCPRSSASTTGLSGISSSYIERKYPISFFYEFRTRELLFSLGFQLSNSELLFYPCFLLSDVLFRFHSYLHSSGIQNFFSQNVIVLNHHLGHRSISFSSPYCSIASFLVNSFVIKYHFG